MTGMVGTALYVSPEVQGNTKATYNQVRNTKRMEQAPKSIQKNKIKRHCLSTIIHQRSQKKSQKNYTIL